jgi:hypothetical protein
LLLDREGAVLRQEFGQLVRFGISRYSMAYSGAWAFVCAGYELSNNCRKISTIVGICGLLIAEDFYNYSIKRRMDLYNYRAWWSIFLHYSANARLQSGHRRTKVFEKAGGDYPISSFHSKSILISPLASYSTQ